MVTDARFNMCAANSIDLVEEVAMGADTTTTVGIAGLATEVVAAVISVAGAASTGAIKNV